LFCSNQSVPSAWSNLLKYPFLKKPYLLGRVGVIEKVPEKKKKKPTIFGGDRNSRKEEGQGSYRDPGA
jgi:hypothetical protein